MVECPDGADPGLSVFCRGRDENPPFEGKGTRRVPCWGRPNAVRLYVNKDQPKFAYNRFGRDPYEVSAPMALPPGPVMLRWEFICDGGKTPGAGGRGDMFINGEQVASGRIDRTIPFFTGTETADVGMDDLTPVTHD